MTNESNIIPVSKTALPVDVLPADMTGAQIFNALSNYESLESMQGVPLVVRGLFAEVVELEDFDTGEMRMHNRLCMFTDKGVVSTYSKTAMAAIKRLTDLFTPDDMLAGQLTLVFKKVSKGARQFYQCEMLLN